MSRWINVGTMLGGVGGAVAAAVAVINMVGPKPIDSAERLIAALDELGEALDSGEIPLDDPDVKKEVVTAAWPVAALLSRNVNALSVEEVSRLPDVEDARSGETVNFSLPDGALTVVSFRWNNVPPAAAITFEGKTSLGQAGWMADVPESECKLLFAGPTRQDSPNGRFQLICS